MSEDTTSSYMEWDFAQALHELAAVTAQRDGHLETIRETFRVLESRGQAPDDNAPLSVNVRRVLDALDRVTAERDALKHAVEQAERALMEIGACSCEIGADVERLVHAHRCALLEKEQATEQLAALKKRLADAPKATAKKPNGSGFHMNVFIPPAGTYALVRLEDGE